MRTNGAFIQDLRAEIGRGQNHRNTYVKLKLAFVVSMLSVGSAAPDPSATIKTAALLYLVPLVAFVFDLYIMGEDYGIKRAGVFIKTSPAAPPEERLWEQELKSKRDLFSRAATPLASLLILVACTVVIARSKISLLPFTPWLIISALLVALTHTKCAFRNSRLKAFETRLTQAAMQNERRKQMQTPATH